MSPKLPPFAITSLCLLLSACAPTPGQWFKKSQQEYKQQNYGQAYLDAKAAAQHGNLQATYAMGYMYYYGIGTSANPVLARQWMNRAAQRGYRPAIRALNLLYNSETKAPHQAALPMPQ